MGISSYLADITVNPFGESKINNTFFFLYLSHLLTKLIKLKTMNIYLYVTVNDVKVVNVVNVDIPKLFKCNIKLCRKNLKH